MGVFRWCVLCCVGVLTSARPHTDTTTADSSSAVSGAPSDRSATNQNSLLLHIRHAPLHRSAGVFLGVSRVRRSPSPAGQSRAGPALVSQSRGGGCSLGTCTVHDLAHRLSQLSKNTHAPMDKISPQGYGR
ncbi:adrenomedullin a [Engraulis encrasicolus]|uniref:adrenomedullin a n=1 Tax=Engraulis encrasicolus TaxID=184585 RepID=UPI002FD29C3F